MYTYNVLFHIRNCKEYFEFPYILYKCSIRYNHVGINKDLIILLPPYIAVMDYNATSEVLEFTAAGEQCVSIPINMDGVLEEEGEQFTVVLTTRDDAIRIGQQFATVTIMESDGVQCSV